MTIFNSYVKLPEGTSNDSFGKAGAPEYFIRSGKLPLLTAILSTSSQLTDDTGTLSNLRTTSNRLKKNGCIPISGWCFGTCFIFPYIGNVIIPIDEVIFFRGVAQPPTRFWSVFPWTDLSSWRLLFCDANNHRKWQVAAP